MVDDNPFAVSPEYASYAPGGDALGAPGSQQFYVDGNLIMCGPVVVLPEICVRTGETSDLVPMRKTLTWVPGWIYVTILISLLITLILYLILRKQCHATYFVSRSVRSRLRWRIFLGVLLFVGGFVTMIAGGANNMPEIGLPVGIVMLITGLVLMVLGSAPITVQRQSNGRQFWLKGFKPEFFDQLRVMYNAR
jgi:hypothetical protein